MTTPDGSWLSFVVKDYELETDRVDDFGGHLQLDYRDNVLYVTFLPYDDTPHTTERYRVTRID